MWNSKKSVRLSMVVLFVIAGCMLMIMIAAPTGFDWFIRAANATRTQYTVLLILFYLSCIPAAATLLFLFFLLQNIRQNQIFCMQNVRLLRLIAWCCFSVCPIALFGSIYFVSLFIICIAAAFMGLILRVIKNVMQAAVALKEENELTI